MIVTGEESLLPRSQLPGWKTLVRVRVSGVGGAFLSGQPISFLYRWPEAVTVMEYKSRSSGSFISKALLLYTFFSSDYRRNT